MSLPLLIRQIFADLIINGPHQNFRFRSEANGVFHLKNEFEITDLIPSIMDFKIGDVNHNAFTFRYIGNKDFTKNELGLYVVKNSVLDTTPVFVINQETKEFTFIGKAYFTKDDGTKALIGSGGSSGGVTLTQVNNILAAKTWIASQITDFSAAVGNYINSHDLPIPYIVVRKNNPQTQKIEYKRYDTVASGYSGEWWTIDEELDQDVHGISHVIRNLDSTRRIQLDKFLNDDSTVIELNFIDSDGYNKIFKIEKKLTDNFNIFNLAGAVEIGDCTRYLSPADHFSVNAKTILLYCPQIEFSTLPRSTNNMQAITDDYSLVHKKFVDTAISGLASQQWVIDKGYINNSSLTSTLTNYITSSSLTTTLSSYPTNSSLNTTLNGYVTTAAFNTYINTQTSGTSAYDSSLYSQVDTVGSKVTAYYKNINYRSRYIYNNSNIFEDYTSFRIPTEVGFGTGYSFTDSSNYEWSFRERNSSTSTPLLQFKTIAGVKSIVATYKIQANGWTAVANVDLTTKGSVDTAINNSDPVGTIKLFIKHATAGLQLPAGYLQCNGGTITSSAYPDLFTALGSTTVPNLVASAPSGTAYIIKALKTSS